jgi:hypothetical protein
VSVAWSTYFWSVTLLIAIMLLAIPVGLIGVLLAWLQKNPLKGRFRVLVVFPTVCILVFASILGVDGSAACI